MSRQSYVFKMRCQVTSVTTHKALISKEIDYKSYREICSGERKKINLGFNSDPYVGFIVKNSSLVQIPRKPENFMFRKYSQMAYGWEILTTFFSIHNIEPNWQNCYMSWGWYSPELGGWTGCIGKV